MLLVAILVFGVSSVAFADKVGLGVLTGIQGKDSKDDKDGTYQADVVNCALVLDDAGKIKAVQFDTVQVKFAFSKDGKMTTDLATAYKTKSELGESYGMKKASPIGAEWDAQARAFEAYCVGKTVDEVLAMPVYKKDDHHNRVPDAADLKSSVTIDVGSFLDVLKKAAENAK